MKANATNSFRVVEFQNPSGATAYRVTGFKRDGERVRKNFPTVAEAEGERQRLAVEFDNADIGTQLVSTHLTKEQVMDAQRAIAELEEGADTKGKTLIDAARFYAKNYRDTKGVTIADGYELFMQEKINEELRPATIRNLRQRLGVMVREIGAMDISTVNIDDIQPLFASRSAVDSNNYRRAFSGFFSWCVLKGVSKGYRDTNPIKSSKAKKVRRGKVQRMSVDEVRAILEAATAHKGGIMVPYVSLALFAGLRPDSELVRLPWKQIHLEDEYIQIEEDDTKSDAGRGARLVEMVRHNPKAPANLALWLKPHHGKTPIYPPNWLKEFKAVKKAAGWGTPTAEQPHLKPWVQDIMRHTAVSFHFKFTNHDGKTAVWAGNSPDVIHKHYKTPANAQELKAFWSITPKGSKAP